MKFRAGDITAQKVVDEDLFSEISRTDVNALQWESDGSDLEDEGKDYDTMTAFDARAYQEYVARKHKGEHVDEEPVFISQEAASMISEAILDDPDDGPTVASQQIFGISQSPRMPKEDVSTFRLQNPALLMKPTSIPVKNTWQDVDTTVQAQGLRTRETDLNQNMSSGENRISNRVSSIVLAILVAVAGLTVFVLQQWSQAPIETPQEVVIYGQTQQKRHRQGLRSSLMVPSRKSLLPMTDVV